MRKFLSLTFFFCFVISVKAQITLTHNVGNTPIYTGMPNCEYEELWGRVFKLSDFGITNNEQFIISSGQTAVSNSYDGARLELTIYALDSGFPVSNPVYIGGGSVTIPEIGETPEIIDFVFSHSVVVSSGVERILVVVSQSSDHYNPDYKKILIAGTEQDNDISWFSGCREYYDFTPTTDLANPVPNANFFINVTGEKFNINSSLSSTTLTHNICDKPVWVNQYGCTGGGINFSRRFVMKDFGVSNNEEFIIYNGQAAFSAVGAWDVRVQINIYKIDSNFPTSFSDLDLLGSSEILRLPYSSDRYNPRIFNFNFQNPVVVPSNVEAILVEVKHFGSSGYSAAFIAGSEQDNDVSWIKSDASGCTPFGVYESRNISYFINVTGNVNQVTNNFEMNISNICSEFLKEFRVEKKDNIASVIWNFGDPASGTNNNSTDLSPFHDFSQDGIYTITATVTGNDGSVEVLTETINVKEPPNAYGIENIYACENAFNSGISSTFDTSGLVAQVLGGQTNKVVKFIDGSGNEYDVLPNPFTNTVAGTETITVRVSHEDNLCCYSETTFDLIVNPQPDLESVTDLVNCSNETNGFAFFNLQQVKEEISSNNSNVEIHFYFENGQEITGSLNNIENNIPHEEVITVNAIPTSTGCINSKTFKLKTNPLPEAHPLNEIFGCDDNNDGISEYFDTSNIIQDVLGDQIDLDVTFFDLNGNKLVSPLSNPYTNIVPNQETLIVRVTNQQTSCYSETPLVLKTTSEPQINQPQIRYACDTGGGYADFDTSNLKSQIIGDQHNLSVIYYDESGNLIGNSFPSSFRNTKPWNQTIYVRVENDLNNLCYSETHFNLVVKQLPEVVLEESYYLCDLEPSLSLNVASGFDSYQWMDQDGATLSNTSEVNLINSGNYKLKISRSEDGITCENSFEFKLVRSALPTITDVRYQELSDNNFIEIMASGDGDFEYSIDGINYQDSNLFHNLLGGIYNVHVRDKLGCGEDFESVTVVDYPKYFTPNDDGVNDTWQIRGISKYPQAKIFIFDRYGKLLKQLSPNNAGWNGLFKGEKLPSTDYWFRVELDNEHYFVGHFALKL